jgi:hypothetical protein
VEVVIQTDVRFAAAGRGAAVILKDELGALIATGVVLAAAGIEGLFAFIEAAETDIVLVLIEAFAATSCTDDRGKDGHVDE